MADHSNPTLGQDTPTNTIGQSTNARSRPSISIAVPQIQGGASSGFAFPSSGIVSAGANVVPVNPFSPEGSLSSTPEATPLGTPTAELHKLNLGIERYARAVQDPGPMGSFSGTVPLPVLPHGTPSLQTRRRSSAAEPKMTDSSVLPSELDKHDGTLATIKRVIAGRTRHQTGPLDDLESNHIKFDFGDEKNEPINMMEEATEEVPTVQEPLEGVRRRKPKGGILSQLLKLQRNEVATVHESPQRSGSGKAAKKARKGFSYRSASRNTSVTSFKDSNSSSTASTPRVSPRNSTVFDTDRGTPDRLAIPRSRTAVKEVAADNRSIHRDIAEILTRQSFLIMTAKALILYGAPSHRIEETCSLLANKMEVDASFSLLPGLMTISFSDPETHTSDTRHLKCTQGMNMHKLACVHKIALSVLSGASIEGANKDLEALNQEPAMYPLWLTLLGWLGSSAFVAPLAFSGGWLDMAVAGFCGLLVGILGVIASKFPIYSNVFEMTASILVGFIAKAFGDRVCYTAVALAGVVVLLPGLLLTQAIMELSSRNIVSGAVRMFYALMYAFFLGFGLTLGAEFWDYVSGSSAVPSPSACQHSIDRWWYFLVYPAVSLSINITFGAHPRQWFGMTLVTSVGLVVTLFLKSAPEITAAIAAFLVGFSGQLWGRVTGQLSYVPLLSGVLLLVPGSVGVRGFLDMFGSDSSQGFTFVLTMIHVSVAITLGVFCSSLVWFPFWRKSTFMTF